MLVCRPATSNVSCIRQWSSAPLKHWILCPFLHSQSMTASIRNFEREFEWTIACEDDSSVQPSEMWDPAYCQSPGVQFPRAFVSKIQVDFRRARQAA